MYYVNINKRSEFYLEVGFVEGKNEAFSVIKYPSRGRNMNSRTSLLLPFDNKYTVGCLVTCSVLAHPALAGWINRGDLRGTPRGQVAGVNELGQIIGLGESPNNVNQGRYRGAENFIPLKVTEEWLYKQNPKEIVVGSVVKVVAQSHGWGEVEAGAIGEVVRIEEVGDTLFVAFDNNPNWIGSRRCFELLDGGGRPVKYVGPPAPKPKMLAEGTEVTISDKSSFYGKADFLNPTDTTGVVVSIHAGNALPVIVKWPSGVQNNYALVDLKVT